MSRRDEFIQVAEQTPFDNDTNGFVADNVQDAIEEIQNNAEVTATPGFTWGDSGAIKNAYLLNDNVASNSSGRVVTLDGFITTLFIATDLDTDQYTLEIRRRVGNTFTTIASLVASSSDGFRKYYDDNVNIAVTKGDELSAYIKKSGNKGATNPVCGIIIKGSI
jgi:hypothetical protein